MHEFGHGLYEHQVGRELDRTPLGRGASLGMHESQSRMWENLVGRSLPFWRHFFPRLRDVPGRARRLGGRALVPRRQPRPALADPGRGGRGTYNLHIILRFELEQETSRARSRRDLPEAWNARDAASTSGSTCPTTAAACSRTCTGPAVTSATSRPTRSAT